MSITGEEILEALRKELKLHDKPENKHNYQRFFKEKLKDPIGFRGPILKKVSNQVYRDVKGLPPKQILDICDYLLASNERYMPYFAYEWAVKIKRDYTKTDFARFERWLKNYVSNWGACDHLSTGPIGNLVLMYPDLSSRIMKWTRSRNRWVKRAAAVSLIIPVRQGMLFDDVIRTADVLMMDDDDMVQKGYGWMLKEATREFPDEVFKYVVKNKAVMPRTALRYAIEKLPEKKRKAAMKRD